MARTKKGTPPQYQRHSSGQARVRLRLADGTRKDVLLGPYESPESYKEYERVLGEWRTSGGHWQPSDSTATNDLTVNELLLRFWEHAEVHYRHPAGTPTDEQHCLRSAIRPLRELYEHTPAKDFGSLALESVRNRMIALGWCRRSINTHVSRIRSIFRWGVAKELVPASVLVSLQAVKGLQRGRSAARETGAVRPVAEEMVKACLPHCNRVVGAMMQVQLLTGMRPGEVVVMSRCDLDRSGEVWFYTPGSDEGPDGRHKTAWRGHGRVVAIGPRAQEIIGPLLKADAYAYIFRPGDSLDDPTWVEKRKPGACYTVSSYRQAIRRACERAFPLPAELGRKDEESRKEWWARLTPEQKAEVKAWRKSHTFHPHQLRHTTATAVRKRFGLEAAQAVLGHSELGTTQVYAETDRTAAARIMREIG